MTLVVACVATIIAYAVLESMWLVLMTQRFYAGEFAKFSPEKLEIRSVLAAVCIYAIIIKAFFWLVILPIKNENLSMLQALLRGAAFGSAVYGVYNLTNKATLPRYPWTLVIVDSLWGMSLFAFLAIIFQFTLH